MRWVPLEHESPRWVSSMTSGGEATPRTTTAPPPVSSAPRRSSASSRTARVGFLGGVETGQIRSFEVGFAAGARYVDPRTRVEVKYISQPPDFTGFADPARGKEVGLALYEQGADVVYHASGSSGQGL